MASGEDKTVPLWMDKLALEFLWRLRTETYRRSKRLTITLYYFIISRILSKYSKIRTYILG
jgi:UDP-N-acetyl-D-mannosaminuronic acid transferase (WecB/TagA/CpsF family)